MTRAGKRKYRIYAAVIFLVLLLQTLLVLPGGTSLKELDSKSTSHSPISLVGDVFPIGDFDRDGYQDIVMTMPQNSSSGLDSGAVFIFWGNKDGFPALEPYNADIILTGEEFFLFGQDVASWDYGGDTWPDLVVGCPGALGGAGKLLVYESTEINIAAKGAVLSTSQAAFEIIGNNTHFFGTHLEVGDMTGDDIDDLMVLSTMGKGMIPRFEVFSGGVMPEFGYEIELPPLSVKNNTRTAALDLYGTGREVFVYSSPDSGEVRIINIEVSFSRYWLPGANGTGVVDFEGAIFGSGNTWGWGAGDDGWDTSPTHIYDSDTGYDSVRYNQQTGNARGADRSIGVENKLFIEVGGVLANSNNRDMSGAYGVSFQLSSSNISGINSAVLSFDWEYEDWGFEAQERLWIKSRLTDSTGDITWLGSGQDRSPEPDLTPEIYTRPGQTNNNGPNLFGTGTFKTDILPLIDGPGEYYLDMGGKVSRWTADVEFGGFGFDNLTLTFRTLSHEVQLMTGSGGLGSGLLSADADRDGRRDLLVGSPTQGTVRIFKGYLPYWKDLPGLNQGMDNTTIEGSPNAGLGVAMTWLGTSPFNLVPSIAIASPSDYVGPDSLGSIYVFDLPLAEGTVSISSARDASHAPEGQKYYGWKLLSVGDHDGDLYPEMLVISWDWSDNLISVLADRSPSPPMLWILNPRRHDVISGHIDISARVFDVDNDTGPEDIRFYRSSDNRSWNPIGDGTPDRIEGDVATKYWNTTLFANGGYFLKVAVEDSFGLEAVKYTDRVDVLNHAPPFIKLLYPADGTGLRWMEEITAKVLIPSSEEFAPPVRFFYSRDNTTWTEFANRSAPVEGSSSDFLAEFDTELFPDGPIWFRVNATTVYGLGSESRNIAPAIINNYYPPEGAIVRPYPGSTISGQFNITVETYDPDDDIMDPVEVYLKTPEVETWELLGNMTRGDNGTYHLTWETTSVDNGEYDLKVRIVDSTNSQIELTLNESFTVHNLYEPSVRITSHAEDDRISSIVTFTAAAAGNTIAHVRASANGATRSQTAVIP
ncbi:MAG: Ig-like domain-containing protein, partial [Thermoplasmatota archaeon]